MLRNRSKTLKIWDFDIFAAVILKILEDFELKYELVILKMLSWCASWFLEEEDESLKTLNHFKNLKDLGIKEELIPTKMYTILFGR